MDNKYSPGELCVINHNVSATKARDHIKLKFPLRIHMTPIDCNCFDFGFPGGGGYGFGIDAQNYIIASFSEDDLIKVDSKQIPVVTHFMIVMKKIFNYDKGFNIEITLDKNTKQHFGLGSTAMISCAVIWAINGLFGWALSKENCRSIFTNNFCEGYQEKYLLKGLDTGVGPYIAFNGGFVITSNDAQIVISEKMPEDYMVVLIDNGSKRPDMDLPESMDMLERSRQLDSYYRYYKAYTVLMDIIPAIRNKDWLKFGKHNLEFQYAGTHLSMIQSYDKNGAKIFSDISDCIRAGALIAGMSSVGPAIYAIADRVEPIIDLCNEKENRYYVYSFNNVGMIEE